MSMTRAGAGALLMPVRNEALAKGLPVYVSGKPCKRGHIGPRQTSAGYCIECQTLRPRQKRVTLLRKPRRPALGLVGDLLRWAKRRSIQKGIEFALTPADILIPIKCPCCNSDFAKTGPRNSRRNRKPSLDRINSAFGYLPGNISI